MPEAEAPFIIRRLSEISVTDHPAVLAEVVRVEQETWPAEIQAPLEKFQARAETFPEGFVTISLPQLGMVGVSTGELIDYDPNNPPHSWEEVTDNGWIRASHQPSGNALYLVSVGASPKAREHGYRGVGTRLVTEQIALAEKLQLRYLVLGSRLPGYAAYHRQNPGVSAQEYLKMIRPDDSLPIDAEIRFYTRCGLKPRQLVERYMEDDPESENYGVVMVWENPNI